MLKTSTPPQARALVLALGMTLGLSAALLATPLAQAQTKAAPKKNTATKPSPASKLITLNFDNAEIESVARTLALANKRNLVVDPRVKGVITLSTDQPVTTDQAWEQFSAVLRLQGFSIVQTNGLYKVVPEAEAKLQGGGVQTINFADIESPQGRGQIVTHIFKLNFEQANNLVPVLRPLISPNNTLNVNPGNNSLIITDYADNLQRLGRIIATLDVSNASDIEVIQLKHAIATDMAPLVLRLLEAGSGNFGGGQPAGPGGPIGGDYKTTLVAEPRSNTLILRAANAARVALVRALVAKLDQPSSSSPSGNIHVVYLKNADATKLATTLRAAISGQASAAAATSPTGFGGAPNQPQGQPLGGNFGAANAGASAAATTGGQIQADTATNSLIITAPEPQYRQLRAVIDMLDQRRAQVMVESLIAEVNADKAAQMGIQWQTANGQKGGTVGIIGTNFNSNIATTQGQGNIISAAGGSKALGALGGGLNIASLKQINGTYVLSSLANFLQQNGDGNVLSTPTLMTIDNEEAKIVVGQNVPFVTGQFTNTGGGNNGAVNPFQTVERKDVGLTLKVKPQISETGTVKLTIFQEVSSIDYSKSSTAGLITNKRSIESNVLVDDGSIIVLGGLLSDEYSGSASQVPLFGDIPLLGWLFKSETRSRSKKNLMVFLRPVVMRDAAATDSLSGNRYQQMLGLQQNAQPGFNPVLGTGNSPSLPANSVVPEAGNAPAPVQLTPTR